jgi:hypothetical protein
MIWRRGFGYKLRLAGSIVLKNPSPSQHTKRRGDMSDAPAFDASRWKPGTILVLLVDDRFCQQTHLFVRLKKEQVKATTWSIEHLKSHQEDPFKVTRQTVSLILPVQVSPGRSNDVLYRVPSRGWYLKSGNHLTAYKVLKEWHETDSFVEEFDYH